MADKKTPTKTVPITVLPPGVDQNEASRQWASAEEKSTAAIMSNQTRPMGSTENTKGDAMLIGGKFIGLGNSLK